MALESLPGHDGWKQQTPDEPSDVVLSIHECPIGALRRACKEELDELTEERLLHIAHGLYFCGMETVTLTVEEAAEWRADQDAAVADMRLDERRGG